MYLSLNQPGMKNTILNMGPNYILWDVGNNSFSLKGSYPINQANDVTNILANVDGLKSAVNAKWYLYFCVPKGYDDDEFTTIPVELVIGVENTANHKWSLDIVSATRDVEHITSNMSNAYSILGYLKSSNRYLSLIPCSTIGDSTPIDFPVIFAQSPGGSFPSMRVTTSSTGTSVENLTYNFSGISVSVTDAGPTGVIYLTASAATTSQSIDEITNGLDQLNDRVDAIISKNSSIYISR